jgi:hypothetical protein
LLEESALIRSVGSEKDGDRLEVDFDALADAFEVIDGDFGDGHIFLTA